MKVTPDWWGRLTALAALAVAVGTLFYSVVDSQRDEKFGRLSVMPRVLIDHSMMDGKFAISVSNDGAGPAIIKWMVVTFDGKKVRDWDEYYKLVGAEHEIYDLFGMLWPEGSLLPGRDAQRTILAESEPRAARLLWQTSDRRRVQICYCSLYGDCEISGRDAEPALMNCEAGKIYDAEFLIPPSMEYPER